MHVAFDERQVQSLCSQPGLHMHSPHSQIPFSGPPHNNPWSRSHEKLSHSQYLPEITSSGLGRLSHSHTPHTHWPLPLQSVSVVLSARHPRLRSDSLCTSMLPERRNENIKNTNVEWSRHLSTYIEHSQSRPKCKSSHSQMPHLYVPCFLHLSELISNIGEPGCSHGQLHIISKSTIKLSSMPTG